MIVGEPAEIPATTPVVLPTLPIDGLLDDHVPPVVASVSVAVAPIYTVVVPVIGATVGSGLTVKVFVEKQPSGKV